MLLGRVFAYPDIQRYRIGANYQQVPVNRPLSEVNSYSKEGAMQFEFPHPAQAEYHPNSLGGPAADPAKAYDLGAWDAEGTEIFRGDLPPHADDTDQVQATILYREVMNDEERERLAANIAGHVSAIHPDETELLERVYAYWAAVDEGLCQAVKAGVEAGPRGNHRLQD